MNEKHFSFTHIFLKAAGMLACRLVHRPPILFQQLVAWFSSLPS